MFDQRPNEQKVLNCLIKRLMRRLNFVKHGQTKSPNGEMFGHQNMVERV